MKKFLIILFLTTTVLSAQTNPFQGGPASPTRVSPGTNSRIYREIVEFQRVLNKEIAEIMRSLEEDNNGTALLTLIFLSFLYGAVHALGPGHRKILISSYFLSENRATVKRGIAISTLSALVHSGSAIALVLILKIVLERALLVKINEFSYLMEIISYSAIVLFTLILIFLKARSSLKRKESHRADRPLGVLLVLFSGLVPCPGAIYIMIFSITLKMVSMGVLSVTMMSMGIAFTVSLIAVLTIKGKKLTVLKTKTMHVLHRALEWGGLLVLLLFSCLMLIPYL